MFPLGKFLELIQLRFERKDLTVFLISTFTNVDVIFWRGIHDEGIKFVSKNRFSKNWNLIYLNNPLFSGLTNRLLSAKSVSWVWKPEYEFAQTLLRRFAQKQFGQNGSLRISASPKLRSPLLCVLLKFSRTYFSKTPANSHAPRAS